MNDYYAELLKIYFKDNNISKNKQLKLLNDNPFDGNFAKWEADYYKSNRIFSRFLKRKKIYEPGVTIKEIDKNKKYSISKYLQDDNALSNCTSKGTILLVRDSLYGKGINLNRIIKSEPHFVIGICTKDKQAYKEKLLYYRSIIKNNDNNNISLVNSEEDGYNICAIKR